MANERIYQSYGRPPIPRNKYGYAEGDVNYSNSVFGSSSGMGSSTEGATVISLDMIDLESFRGATNSEPGTKGVVPAPGAGMQDWFLKGDASWTRIPAYEWLHEFPASEGLEKTGLEIDGDFNVTNTLKTMNLEVQGSAWFWELVIEKVRAQGGQVLISPSMFHIDYVGEVVQYDIFDIGGTDENSEPSPLIQLLDARTDIYNALVANGIRYIRCFRLYQRSDDGEKTISNECRVGDMMRCHSFNIKEGAYRNVSNTDYWSFVVNMGTGSYIDPDHPTDDPFEAIYIDLAFTLRDEAGHNFPLGTTLYTDGTYTYPTGYTEILDALELKKVSQEMWDGTDNVEEEFFENAEWVNIQEKVIDIRGLEDQIADLTGRANSNSIGRSKSDIESVEAAAETAISGITTNTRSGAYVNTIRGTSSLDYDTEPQTDEEEREALDLANEIRGGNGYGSSEAKAKLKIDRVSRSELVLEKNIVTDRTFVAGADLYDQNNQLSYTAGQTIPFGTTTLGDWKVIDTPAEDIATKQLLDSPTPEPVPEEEKVVIDTFTVDTPKGVDRDTENYMSDQADYPERTSWLFGWTGLDYSKFRIKEGDDLACLGHLYDSDRQNAIVLSSIKNIDPDLIAPSIAQYSHLDTFGTSISKYRQTAIAANGNEFMGQFFINYNNTFVDVNDRINMMIMDVETGLEAVGIHLDGENSTMKMVGSIELRQHDQTNGDTLSVFDSLGRKKVEIIPKEVPSRNDPENPVEYTKHTLQTIRDRKNAGKDYINYEKTRKNIFYSWSYVYELKYFNLKYTTSVDLGYIKTGYDLTLSKLNLKLLCKNYLVGNVYVSSHGDPFNMQQQIYNLKCSLKVNGGYIRNPENLNEIIYKDIDLMPTMDTPQNILTDEISVTHMNKFLEIIDMPYNGTYTLEVTVEWNDFGWYKSGTQYPDYYYTVDCGVSGTVESALTKEQTIGSSVSKMTIGTNGLYFLGNNNLRYMYAGDEGYEMSWDNAKIQLDAEHGLALIPTIQTITENTVSKVVNSNASLVVCDMGSLLTSGYTITLPQISSFGYGREITILGFPLLVVTTATGDYINVMNVQATSINFSDLDVGLSLKLVSYGNVWYALSYN